MPFRAVTVRGLVAADPTTLGTASLGATYGRVMGFVGQNFASIAMGGAGSDTSIIVKLTDANGHIFYLENSGRDYATAAKWVFFAADDTATGVGQLAVDSTGATATAGASVPVVVKSPITITLVGGGTATDYFSITLYAEV